MKRMGVVSVCMVLMGCLPAPTPGTAPGSDASSDVGQDVSVDASGDVGIEDTGGGMDASDAADAMDAMDASDASDASVEIDMGVERVDCATCDQPLTCVPDQRCGPGVCLGGCAMGAPVCQRVDWDLTTFTSDLDANTRANSFFGHSTAMTPDGLVMAVATGEGRDGLGIVVVRDACGTSQVIREATEDGSPDPNDPTRSLDTGYGDAIALSADGLTLAVGERFWDAPDGKVDSGRVLVYTRDTLSDEFIERGFALEPPRPANSQFGASIALSPDGSIMLVTFLNPTGSTGSGAVSAWSLVDGVATFESVASGGGSTDFFGRGMAVSWEDGLVAVGASQRNGKKGSVYVIDFAPDWKSSSVNELGLGPAVLQSDGEAGGSADAPIRGSQLGQAVAISPNGNYIAAGAAGHINTLGASPYREGLVFVWKRSGNTFDAPQVWGGPSGVPSAIGGSVAVGNDGVVWASSSRWGNGTIAGINYAGPGALFRIDSESSTGGASADIQVLGNPEFQANFLTSKTVGLGTNMVLSEDGEALAVGAQASQPDDVVGGGKVYLFRVPSGSSN